MEQIRFDRKTAIVTGAGSGLGRAYAIDLAKRGANVVVNDLGCTLDGTEKCSLTPAEKVTKEITDLGGIAVASAESVDDEKGSENIVKKAIDSFGKVDILINNAGILRDRSFLKMTGHNWGKVLNVHLNGTFNVTRHAVKSMRENQYGRIVMISSAAGLYGNFGQSSYSAAKLGIVGFMNTIKIELEKYNIKINSVAPIAASRMTENVLPKELFEQAGPRFVSPLVLFLASEKCDATGAIFNAGLGSFNRAAVLTGPGIKLGDKENPPSPEQIYANWDKLYSLEPATEFKDSVQAFLALLK